MPSSAGVTRAAAAKPHASAAAAEPDAGGAGLDRFVAAVQRELPDVALDRRDEEVAELGQQACASLAAGKKAAAVAEELREVGVAAPDARKLIVIAQDTACRT